MTAITDGPLDWAPVHALDVQIRSRNEQCWSAAGWARTRLDEARALRPALIRDAGRTFPAVFQGGAFRAMVRTATATPPSAAIRSRTGSVSPEALAVTATGMVSSCGEGVVGSCAAALAGEFPLIPALARVPAGQVPPPPSRAWRTPPAP